MRARGRETRARESSRCRDGPDTRRVMSSAETGMGTAGASGFLSGTSRPSGYELSRGAMYGSIKGLQDAGGDWFRIRS